MPKTVVKLSEHADRVVNVVKAPPGRRGKSEAIERSAAEHTENLLAPARRPEFVVELQRVRRARFRKVGSLDEVLRDSA
jgi:hypothetical protein